MGRRPHPGQVEYRLNQERKGRICPMAKKLGLRETYAAMTRGVNWTPSYVKEEEAFPYHQFEGIKIHDWDKWEDPFRMTVDNYWKYQSEKDRRLYAVLDSFSQN